MSTGRTLSRRVRALAFLALLAASPAAAGQDVEGRRGRANRAAPLNNAQLLTMLDTYAIVEAQTFLQLEDEKYGQFVTRLKRLQETRRRNVLARTKMLQALRRLTAPDTATDDATLRERVQALRTFDEQAAVALRREYDAVDELLTPRQQARFRILEERMEFRKLDLLMRARERARNAQPRPDGVK